ncbi:MAG: hybrid sensor histidine kinase/response regulator [Lysobacteraceae bacterium]|nr:MAG: hybrid sensor histidine kinase/response regulator [Xanthomonadaceae bacterium]
MPQSAASLDPASVGPVRILQVEDSAEDAELLSMELLDAGLEAEFLRVESAEGLERAISGFAPHLVLSDLSMPGFSGQEALRIVRRLVPDLPFIFVSGTMGEDTAVQALHEGADDYILKDKTARLPTAVVRAIREARSLAERARVEQELLRAQRLDCLAMLAAGLSHDLRNILQPLLIVPDLLAIHSDDPKIHKLGQVISESGRRGHEMAESMLAFVRGSGVARERVDVAALLQAVQLLLHGSLGRQVRLEVESLPEGELVTRGNYTELQQSLLNLCLNAVQAMPDGGTVTVSARQREEARGSVACISVADTGVGMDAQTLAQLFTPFFSTKSDGTGLGLVSCKRIVETYDGRIEVRSEPGRGTTFEIILPILQDDAEAEAIESAAAGQGQRILIVDGDATRLSLIGNALVSQGYQPMRALDGAIALQAMAVDMPDLAIIDNDILLLSAASLLSTMRERGYAGPVVVLQDPSKPLEQGSLVGHELHVLEKPLKMGQLFAAVEQALQGPARSAQALQGRASTA